MRDFESAVGFAGGRSYIANIGRHGKRELISLGSCANLAAKILGGRDTITITMEDVRPPARLPQEPLREAVVVSGVQTYRAKGLRWSRFS